jgi:plastocyanin
MEILMNDEPSAGRTGVPLWMVLLVAIAALVLATAALTATLLGGGAVRPTTVSMNGLPGGMMGGGMMGGYGNGSGPAAGGAGPVPGESGFVAGTAASPRVIQVVAGPGYGFTPKTIAVAPGETVTFVVTAVGPAVHEFMVGPAAAVAADVPGTPEVSDIAMMQTKSLTYTFDGDGPYAFACHAERHYEAGMHGTITIVG